MNLKCLIVDDDLMSRKALEKLCGKIEGLEVVALCADGSEALNLLQQEPVDLMFLDIHMPELGGMDLVRNIRQLPQIVFTTSDKDHALEAFELNATDYLVKPINLARLMKAMQKVKQLHSPGPAPAQSSEGDVPSHFFAKVDNRLVKVFYDEIRWVESYGDYIQLHTAEKRHVIHMTLKKVAERLPEEKFLRVHRQYIVNLDKVIDIQDNSILIGDKVIPISRSHRDKLMERLNLL
jgi:two-component system response regulator LytT